MDFPPEQERALKRVNDWITRSDQQVFKLFGYAGTGKTTLAKHFAEGVNGTVLFGAFTGKAAYVLQSKGCNNATTIHSMIYLPKGKSQRKLNKAQEELTNRKAELSLQGCDDDALANDMEVQQLTLTVEDEQANMKRPIFELNPDSEVKHAALIIIDECSMVGEKMGEDLLSFGTKVLVLGDPAQLPPVGGAGFFTAAKNGPPDVMLTQIHRQAKDSPIIALATKVRNQEALSLGNYGECLVVNKIEPEEALAADQILVGKNTTRSATNKRIRALKGFEGLMPIRNDKLVCLRNNHELGLLNGGLWTVKDILSDGQIAQLNNPEGEDFDPFDEARVNLEDKIGITVKSESGTDIQHLITHTHYFEGKEKNLQWWEKKEAEEFDYGYALTVHKSQGSQWDHVALFDQSAVFKKDRWKWLYTGITRAAKNVRIILM